MDSRINKHNENNEMSRVSRHESLYKKINEGELDNFSVKSNATVIGNQEPEIDIEKIKKILDMKYSEAPKRKSIRVEPREEENKVIDEIPTKEYDLNAFLEKAKDDKEESYEEVRAKKLRNTQFDILNNLNINNKTVAKEPDTLEEKPEMKKAEEDLMDLINTITINESKIREEKKENLEVEEGMDPLNILEDLKGDENTEVYKKIAEEVKAEATKNIDLDDTVLDNQDKDNKIDDSFYTQSLFKKKDFEEDDDFTDSKMSIWLKILIFLVIVVFAGGLFLFLRSFLNF